MHRTATDLEEIFFAALEHTTPDARAAFLADRCGEAPELRELLERMLASEALVGRFLESPAIDPPPALTATGGPRQPPTEGPGAVIGPYKLLEVIGEGGMGTVYMAEQAAPVRRRVALKVIKPGMDSKQVVARFEAERQALALMDHPNIARVFDGGMTPSGRPYFVMELVRGLPITEYCDREALSIAERLDLFVLVCRAVQHAHQKGVIHRDLKPSNVLVTVIDGAAVPKVIDFGVAKATGPALTEKTLLTGFHQFVGTPLYVSPEQAELSGVDVDTRSDIYSLGVLLYELLTGTTPFDAETLGNAAFDEMRRIIREEEPPRPSTRLSTLGDRLTTISARRKADPRRLGAAMKGELDWVVMKALEKDRRRRYETSNDFAADVMRYLTDRPVAACPPSARYRFGKFARRNRAALTTALLVGLALVAGMAVSTWQAVRATRAEQRTTAALEESRLIVEYLVKDVFGAAAPERNRGRTPTIHDLLAAGETIIPARFGGRPLAEAAAREALGRAFMDLGRYDNAEVQFQHVASLRTRALGPDHPDTLAARTLVIHAMCPPSIDASKAVEAEPLARQLLEANRRVYGPAHPRTLSAMTSLAHVLTARWVQILLAESRRYPSGMVPDDIMSARGTPAMGEPLGLLRQALDGQIRQLGPAHPETLETLVVLGNALWGKADFVAAVEAHRRAADGRRGVLGPTHPATLLSRKLLADSIRRLGRTEEAHRMYIEVAEAHREIFGPNHIQTSSALGRLILSCRRLKDADTMREVCERWLREILASPIDPDPYQHNRRKIMLEYIALVLTTLHTPAPFDTDLALRVAAVVAEFDGGWYDWATRGAILFRLGRLDDARQALTTSTQQPNWTGGNDLYWFTLASIHGRSGDLTRASECYERGRAPETRRDTWHDITQVFRAEAEALLGKSAPSLDPKTHRAEAGADPN